MKDSLLKRFLTVLCAYGIGSISLLIFPGIRHYPLAWLAMHLGSFSIFPAFGMDYTDMSLLGWLIWFGLTILWAACTFGYLAKPNKLTRFAMGFGVFLWFFSGVFIIGQDV